MVPARFGTRPRIVRVRTDLPCPDAPTKPRISPLYTSRSRPFMMVRSPKPTSRPRTLMTTSRSRSRSGCDRVSSISVPNGRKKHGEEAVEHDDHKDRLHDRGCDMPAEGLRRPLDGEAFDGRDDADHQRHERRLQDTDQERVEADRRP